MFRRLDRRSPASPSPHLHLNVSSLKSDLATVVVQAEDNERREKNLEEAKKIVIEDDPNLPKPDTVGFMPSLNSSAV